MFAEYFQTICPTTDYTWYSIMPGIKVCRFAIQHVANGFPISLSTELDSLHFEALFCQSGTLMIGQNRLGPITVTQNKILLLSDTEPFKSAQILSPMQGILVSVNGFSARKSLDILCGILYDMELYLNQVHHLMKLRHGHIVLNESLWSQNVFNFTKDLPTSEQGRYCFLKTMELLYLLCTHDTLLTEKSEPDLRESYLTRTVSDMQSYMSNHLDEKLTIDIMSRKFHISPTAFKSCFRRLYGQPVHGWLQLQRMKQAAQYLCSSPMSILQVAQAVGYEGVSQFNVAFKRQYGVTPKQYRKMSDTGNF